MNKSHWLGAAGALLAVTTLPASAQSSGNFAATVLTPQCEINKDSAAGPIGGLLGGSGSTGLDDDGNVLLRTTVQTPNSAQTALLVTPSLVTGLFTDTNVTESQPTSTQSAAVVVYVTLDGKPLAPDSTDDAGNARGIVYDERFQQLSTNVFAHIEECRDENTDPDGPGPQEADEECNIDLLMSTLSAHSFNFVAPAVGGGNHTLEVKWDFVCYTTDGADADSNPDRVPCSTSYAPNTAGACVGPGSITVQQVKTFSQSGGITVK